MAHCLIALGSNLGNRAEQLQRAMLELSRLPQSQLVARSGWYETPPIGGPAGQGMFLNAAALVSSSLEPLPLLAHLRCIEAALGRQRVERWAARSLDLDLLLDGDRVVHTPELTVPHPRMAYRRFVLAPAAEVAPWMIHPDSGWSVQALLRHLNTGEDLIAVAAAEPTDAATLIAQLAARLELSSGDELPPRDGRPAIVRWDDYLACRWIGRPKLILAVEGTGGVELPQLRRMLQLPAGGPIGWIAGDAEAALADAIAAVQAVWPALAGV